LGLLGTVQEASRRLQEAFWDVSVKLLGLFWEAPGTLPGGFWALPGFCKLPGAFPNPPILNMYSKTLNLNIGA